MKVISTDCLVIGSGAAGSTYALEASRRGLNCLLLAANEPKLSNSWLAQGGVIYPQEGDEELLCQDILTASGNTANLEVVRDLVENGRRVMEQLLLEITPFDRVADGSWDLTKEAAHSKNRIVHSKDRTGQVLTQSLWDQFPENVDVQTNKVVVDLLTLSHSSLNRTDRYKPSTCIGAYVLDDVSGEVSAILAQRTILATGGLGQVFANTTNSADAYGHGVSMAYRVGARIMDMEYVQFHPTALQLPGATRQFLISESLRGEGATFLNSSGEDFMSQVHPGGSLAPRDILSRGVFFETMKSGEPHVYLDVSRVKDIKERFPDIYTHCLQSGLDICEKPIPVAPAAHYSCGGIHADLFGNTNVMGLKAIGENACTGLHGANRLASTSLLECVVMGSLAAEQDAADLAIAKLDFPEVRQWQSAQGVADMDLIQQDLKLIKSTMWNYVGLVRTEKRLNRAEKILRELKTEIDQFYADCILSRPLLNLRAAMQSSLLVVYAALRNTRSEGCHYRNDELENAIAASKSNGKQV